MQGFADQKNQLDATIKTGHFLQSKEWEEFQKSLGREVFRVGGVLVVKLPLAFEKSYLYSAGTSDLRFSARGGSAFGGMIYDLRKLTKENQAVFLKYEQMTEDEGFADELLNSGFVKSKKEVQPQKTTILDLIKSEDELLREMHQKTRYNIRLASRMSNIKCQMSNDSTGFWELIQKTAQRDRFSTHERKYYEKFSALPDVKLFAAENQNKTVAANIVLFYDETVYYLHGASDYEYRNFMAPYLLHWETIKYAKEHGYKQYDLWGIDEKKWPGVTRFKRGFGGREVTYIGSYDYVFQPFWYKFYTLRNKLKVLR